MKKTNGGVAAPSGFTCSAGYCGIGDDKEKGDIALIYSEVPGSAAAVYTKNKVKAAHIGVMKEHLAGGKAQAVICNSGNANTCTVTGTDVANEVCDITGWTLGIDPGLVLPASTGIIGVEMDIEPFREILPELADSLSDDSTASAKAIMTTDTVPKETAYEFTCGGKTCRIGAVAKGSGMIHINMGTMLSFMTTDAAISSGMLQKALSEEILDSYNQVSVDGDTSTNDTLLIIANGLAGNDEISVEGPDYDSFREALHQVSVEMARGIAADGEGAGKLIEAHVKGASSKEHARSIAKSVIGSNLVKTAVFGEDANWGRVLCSIGYAEGDFSCEDVDVDLASEAGKIAVCRGSKAVGFSEDEALRILKEDEVRIEIDMHSGDSESYAWGCDMTYDYVKINGEYRT